MLLQPQAVYVVPEDTAQVARSAFPKGTLCLRLHDELGRLYTDQDFAALFPRRGQPALAPARMRQNSDFGLRGLVWAATVATNDATERRSGCLAPTVPLRPPRTAEDVMLQPRLHKPQR